MAVYLPGCRSLKAKRSVVRSAVDVLRRRYRVAVAETDHQGNWQRAELVVAVVAGQFGQASEILDEVERFVWSVPEWEVLEIERSWLEHGW